MSKYQYSMFDKELNKDFKVENDSPVQVVVPLSGGRDSQSCLKLAVAAVGADRVLALFCDTQFEHPWTYGHVKKCGDMYGVTVIRVCEGSVEGAVRKYKRFPGGGARHCTELLKIIPSKKFYHALAEANGPFEVWCGIKADESHERRKRYVGKVSSEIYDPNDFMAKYPKYLGKAGVRMRLPIIEWSVSDVMEYLDGEHNPLYDNGFDRVGCFPCLAAGDKPKEIAFAFDETGKKHKEMAVRLAKEFSLTLWRSKGGKERNAADFEGCAICSI